MIPMLSTVKSKGFSIIKVYRLVSAFHGWYAAYMVVYVHGTIRVGIKKLSEDELIVS
jgi:hypothetical protein